MQVVLHRRRAMDNQVVVVGELEASEPTHWIIYLSIQGCFSNYILRHVAIYIDGIRSNTVRVYNRANPRSCPPSNPRTPEY
jgi:hypothetical protein